MADSPSFIHLRVHSAYSLKEGALHVKKLPGLCETLGFPALAVTETNNLFGALEFSECCARAGVQPVMGLQLAVAYGEPAPGERPVEPAPLALYAQDQTGWLNLMALSSSAFLDTDTTQLPHVTLEALAARAHGVICLTGGAGGPLGKLLQANRRPAAEALAQRRAISTVLAIASGRSENHSIISGPLFRSCSGVNWRRSDSFTYRLSPMHRKASWAWNISGASK